MLNAVKYLESRIPYLRLDTKHGSKKEINSQCIYHDQLTASCIIVNR